MTRGREVPSSGVTIFSGPDGPLPSGDSDSSLACCHWVFGWSEMGGGTSTYHRPPNALLRVWERGVRALPQIQIVTR